MIYFSTKLKNWNGVKNFIFFGKNDEFATNNIEEHEISALSLYLLQNCLVYINTLMIQSVFSESKWFDVFTSEDYRGMTPLIYNYVNPYGSFDLDMNERIII